MTEPIEFETKSRRGHIKKIALVTAFVCFLITNAFPQEKEMPRLENPFSEQYLKSHLRKSQPRLILNHKIERCLLQSLKTDPVVQNMYKAIRLNAAKIQKEPLLERIVEGRRLLSVSREMLYRINMLGMVYRVGKDPDVLDRINDEVVAVCNFSDWNPQHYLDVAEMSLAVALALDWTAGNLPQSTIELVQRALIEKGIKPGFIESDDNWWIQTTNNWSQVCHAGMIAASIAIAEVDSQLAAKTIWRALDSLPYALKEYKPDGVYPEGAMYWGYGTSFTIMAADMLESAFGSDFGITDYPGLKASAMFKELCTAPSGWYFNYGDCADKRGKDGDLILAWFAAQTGNKAFYEKDRFLRPAEEMGRLSRLAGAGLVWLSQYKETGEQKMPAAWKGDGANPVVLFTGEENDPHQYYFGAKGGCGTVNHGNMDGGSFVFELNGVRWSVDPGGQPYNDLEQAGFDLWSTCQECERWTLLTKNNYGHSTLTVNNQLHVVNGKAEIVGFKDGDRPEATIDLTATFAGQLKSARRRFVKDGPASLTIEDQLELLDSTKLVCWQMMTTADVQPVAGGAILKQDGKELKLDILSPEKANVSVVMLDPAPMKLDRQIKNLKRIEIRMPAWIFENGKAEIRVRLLGANSLN